MNNLIGDDLQNGDIVYHECIETTFEISGKSAEIPTYAVVVGEGDESDSDRTERDKGRARWKVAYLDEGYVGSWLKEYTKKQS